MISFIVAATFFSVSFCGVAVYFWYYQRFLSEGYRISHRIDSVSELRAAKGATATFVVRQVEYSQIPLLNRVLEKVRFSFALQKMMERADMPPKVGTVLIVMTILATLGFLFGLTTRRIGLGIGLGLVLAYLPVLFISMRVGRRLQSFGREFPDAIDMMTGALRAGHAFSKALQLVAMEAPDPVGTEFRRTFEEHNLGRPIKECLLHLTERVNSPDLKLFVTAVLLQRETGGNLTEILEKISYTIRERFKLMGQIQVYTAQGRMSAWILGSLPAVFLFLISSINPGYLQPMFTESSGHYMLITAGLFQIVGVFMIRKIVHLDFN